MTADLSKLHTAVSPLRLAIGGLLALAATVGIGRFIGTPIIPPINAALGLSEADAGLIASASDAGNLAGAIAVLVSRLPGSQPLWPR